MDDIPLERFNEIGSTSGEAKRRARAGLLEGPIAIVAERQSGGYGRLGRVWHAPVGGLWWTLAWPVEGGFERAIAGLGLRVGAACLEAITLALGPLGVGPERIRLKWPNDILIDGFKASGCLVEAVHDVQRAGRMWLIVGVGVNVNNDPVELPGDLRRAPTSLGAIGGCVIQIDPLREALTRLVIRAIVSASESEHADMCRRVAPRLHGLGAAITLRFPDQSTVSGVLRGLSEEGRLILVAEGGGFVAPGGVEIAD